MPNYNTFRLRQSFSFITVAQLFVYQHNLLHFYLILRIAFYYRSSFLLIFMFGIHSYPFIIFIVKNHNIDYL